MVNRDDTVTGMHLCILEPPIGWIALEVEAGRLLGDCEIELPTPCYAEIGDSPWSRENLHGFPVSDSGARKRSLRAVCCSIERVGDR